MLVPKYSFMVLHGEVRAIVREIIRQVCAEMDVTIINVRCRAIKSICFVAAIENCGRVFADYFPAPGRNPNELPNDIVETSRI